MLLWGTTGGQPPYSFQQAAHYNEAQLTQTVLGGDSGGHRLCVLIGSDIEQWLPLAVLQCAENAVQIQ